MRSPRYAGAVGVAVALLGCSGAPAEDRPGPAAPASAAPTTVPTTATAPTSAPTRALEPVPAELRVRLPRAGAVPVEGGVVVDLVAALGSPTVDEAPVGAGLLLAQVNLFYADASRDDPEPGQPFLMTSSGAWRQLDLTRYGLRSPAYGELSMAISRDGRYLALADPSGLVTVDLRDNSFERFDLPVREAVALAWSADGSMLVLKDRHSRRRPCGPKGCTLDLSTGQLSVLPSDLFYSAPGRDGTVVELRTDRGGRSGEVVTYRDASAPVRVPLQFRTGASTGGGPAAARHVAYAQCAYRARGGDPGVVVVDPASGAAVAMLTGPSRRDCRLVPRTWLTDRRLLVGDYVEGDLWLWDVPLGRVQQVGTSRTRGVNYSVARDVMTARLRQSLQR